MTAMEGELEPLDPAPPAVSQRPWARVAGVSVGALLGVAALTAVAVSSTWRAQPREADLGAETVEFFRRGGDDRRPAKHHHKEQSVDSESESESSSGGSTSCSAVTCAPYGEAKSGDHTCDGDPTSDACINKCCKEVECSSLGSGFCSSLGPDYSERKISFFERGLPQRTGKCRGEADCEDACCQNLCSGFTCPSGTCPSKFPPTKCTKSECQLQCCVQQQKYCGGGFNAYTAACYACESTESYCEAKLEVTRSAVSTKEWNKKAFAAVEAGTVEPGCEISKHYVPTCQSELKYTLTSQFSLHKTSEAVSVNTVAVIPGGFAALSGGDDQQVYEWTIANGGPLHNFSGAASPVLQVAALNDATYFCAASHTEAIVWLLQPRYGEEIQGQSELPMDTREGAPPVGNTGCIGLNTWETVLVGQNNSFAVMWHWKANQAQTMPVDPKLPLTWQISADAGYNVWPAWDVNGDLQAAFVDWRVHLFGLDDGYTRRLQENNTVKPARRLKRAGPASPFLNWFTNLRWGDVPRWYYEPEGWGKVLSLVEVPSNLYVATGYEDGSIRVWYIYNQIIKAVIPKAHIGGVNAMMAAPAGDIIYSGGDDGWIRWWQAADGKPLGQIYVGHAGRITSLAMVPGGGSFYSGHSEGEIYFWATGYKDPLCVLDPEGGQVNSIAVNPAVVGQIVVALSNGHARVYTQR